MRTDRLLKLADFLEGDIPGKFSLFHWRIDEPCGTTACALGWAASIFKRNGLKVKEYCRYDNVKKYNVVFQNHYNISAAAEFFEIETADAQHLFYPSHYEPGKRGRRDVARRIRKFVRSKS